MRKTFSLLLVWLMLSTAGIPMVGLRLTDRGPSAGPGSGRADPAGLPFRDVELTTRPLTRQEEPEEDWLPERRMSYTYGNGQTGQSYQPALAVDRRGNLHVVWTDDANGKPEVYYKMVSATGDTLINDTRMTVTNSNSSAPSVACDSVGKVHIVWNDNRDGNFEVYYMKVDPTLANLDGYATDPNLVKVIPDQRLTSDAEQSMAPEVACDSKGCVHVVWQDDRVEQGEEEKTWDIYYTMLGPNGQTLVDDTCLTEGGTADGLTDKVNPDIAIDELDNVHITWSTARKVDFAFLIDCSGSMDNEWHMLADILTEFMDTVRSMNVDAKFTVYYMRPSYSMPDIPGRVDLWYAVYNGAEYEIPDSGGGGECWLPSTTWAALGDQAPTSFDHVWRESVLRIIVPISDETGYQGDWHTQEDENALLEAIAACVAAPPHPNGPGDPDDSVCYPFYGDGADSEVLSEMQRLAAGTGGQYFYFEDTDSLAREIKKLLFVGEIYYSCLNASLAAQDGRASSDDVLSVIDDTRITFDPLYSGNPHIAVGSDLQVHIVWHDARDYPGSGDLKLFETYYTRLNYTWDDMNGNSADDAIIASIQDLRLTEDDEVPDIAPDVAVTPDNVAYVVWCQKPGEGSSPETQYINYAKLGPLHPAGTPPEWYRVTEVLSKKCVAGGPAIATDLIGGVHIAWSDDATRPPPGPENPPHDGRFQLYYRGTQHPGIYLSCPDEILLVEPGHTGVFNVTVWNFGPVEEEIALTASEPVNVETGEAAADWSAFVVSNVTVGPGSATTVEFGVRAPYRWENLTMFQMVSTVLFAQSTREGQEKVNASFEGRAMIDIRVDFRVEFNEYEDAFEQEDRAEVTAGKKSILSLGVANLGNLNDTYLLELRLIGGQMGARAYFEGTNSTQYPVEWELPLTEATLSGARVFEVPGRDFMPANGVELPIVVEVPKTERDGTEYTIEVVGRSVRDMELLGHGFTEALKRSDKCRVTIVGSPDIELSVAEEELWAGPGESVRFEVKVTNWGNKEAEVTLGYEGGAVESEGVHPTEWTAHFDGPKTLRVSYGRRETIGLVVTAPSGGIAMDRCLLSVVGTFVGADGKRHDAVPVEVVAIVKLITNLTVTATQWDRNGNGLVNVYTPMGEEVHDLSDRHVKPGEVTGWEVLVSNQGNGEDAVSFEVADAPMGWNTTVLLGSAVLEESLPIGYYSEARVNVTALVNPYTMAGRYGVVLNVTSVTGYTTQLLLEVEVDQVYAVELNPADALVQDEGKKEVSPGRAVTYVSAARNEGNGPDVVHFSASGVPDSWWASFTSVSNAPTWTDVQGCDFGEVIDLHVGEGSSGGALPVWPARLAGVPKWSGTGTGREQYREIDVLLDVNETAYVVLTVEVPRDAAAVEQQMGIEASTHGVEERAAVVAAVDMPDLEIVGRIEHPTRYEAGRLARFTVTVSNKGNVDAYEVLVRLYVDGEAVEETTIVLILQGGEANAKSATMYWRAEPGEHRIKVVVDPENRIAELSDTSSGPDGNGPNNEASLTVTVGGGMSEFLERAGVFLPIGLLAILVIAGAITASVVVVRRSGGSDADLYRSFPVDRSTGSAGQAGKGWDEMYYKK